MLDILEKHLQQPEKVQLTTDQAIQLERLKTAYELLRSEPSRRRVVKKLQSLFAICERTAYNDITWAQRLFSQAYRYETDFLRNIIIENALEQLRLAKTGKINHKAWSEANNILMKMYLADKAEGDKIDPSMLGNNTYLVVLPMGDKLIKYNLMEMDKLPAAQRESLVEKLFSQEISEIEAAEFLELKPKNGTEVPHT